MSNNINILNAQSFLTKQLLDMQAEMDQMAESTPETEAGNSGNGDSNVVDIHTLEGKENIPLTKHADAALVTGTFEFRPTTQVRHRMTVSEVDKAMDELEVVLNKLGVEISFDHVETVELTA